MQEEAPMIDLIIKDSIQEVVTVVHRKIIKVEECAETVTLDLGKTTPVVINIITLGRTITTSKEVADTDSCFIFN
jgi:hypothetical protein